jgi:hypothetical protein
MEPPTSFLWLGASDFESITYFFLLITMSSCKLPVLFFMSFVFFIIALLIVLIGYPAPFKTFKAANYFCLGYTRLLHFIVFSLLFFFLLLTGVLLYLNLFDYLFIYRRLHVLISIVLISFSFFIFRSSFLLVSLQFVRYSSNSFLEFLVLITLFFSMFSGNYNLHTHFLDLYLGTHLFVFFDNIPFSFGLVFHVLLSFLFFIVVIHYYLYKERRYHRKGHYQRNLNYLLFISVVYLYGFLFIYLYFFGANFLASSDSVELFDLSLFYSLKDSMVLNFFILSRGAYYRIFFLFLFYSVVNHVVNRV